MKLTDIKAAVAQDEEIADIPIFGKNGEPYLAKDGTQCTIGVVGSESKDFRKAEDAISRKNLRNSRRTGPEDLRENRIAQHAACVKRWHGWEGEDDAGLSCTPENVRALLTVEHILDQVVTGIHGHASFFTNSSSS